MAAAPPTIEKVRDIVGLYLSPPDRALVLCVDEKTEIQALERTRPVLPMRPGRPEQRTSDYVRHGTCSLFAALDVAAGEVIGRCYRRHRAEEFRDLLDAADAAVPGDLDLEVHPVLDNASIHKAPPIRRGAPLLGSSDRPASRAAANRSRHSPTVWAQARTSPATAWLVRPSAQRRTMRARSASPCGAFRRRARPSSSARSGPLSSIGVARP